MPCYLLHGKRVVLSFAWPGLVEAAAGADADIAFMFDGCCDPLALPSLTEPGWIEVPLDKRAHATAARLWCQATPDGVRHLIRFSGGDDHAEFVIAADTGRVGVVWTRPEAQMGDLVHLALGPVLGLILRLEGQVTLHAGAVAMGGCAVAIAGPSGSGKSTLVAHLIQHGGTLLSDDMSVIVAGTNSPLVLPGQGGVKLWPQSLEHLGEALSDWPTIFDSAKRHIQFEPAVSIAPVPLSAILLLGGFTPGIEDPVLERLSPREAFLALAAELYLPFVPLRPAGQAILFQRQCLVASRVPILRALRPRGLDALPDLSRTIVEEIFNDTRRS
ncbi:MAG TPA: hypothetical protein VGV37_21750 [Aliidongia sp.]|uniref:hypothetical protein n=1 Tax=Aliidongia sp. TaxID=1914230 RepID=UPI002DDCD42F|nr:hypothetical protein [Aliidongia sp.]HEV2677167.1 hypothetical protein [Aliidongia sp.]